MTERKEVMEKLAAKLFYLIPGMDREQKKYYLETVSRPLEW